MWTIDQIEINGGFLPGLKTALPNGLNMHNRAEGKRKIDSRRKPAVCAQGQRGRTEKAARPSSGEPGQQRPRNAGAYD